MLKFLLTGWQGNRTGGKRRAFVSVKGDEGGAILMEISRVLSMVCPSELLMRLEVLRKATYQPMITPLLDESSAKTEEAERRVQ